MAVAARHCQDRKADVVGTDIDGRSSWNTADKVRRRKTTLKQNWLKELRRMCK